MDSPLEFCPKCRGYCSPVLSLGLRRTTRQDGHEDIDIIFHLHCRSCNAYIRSYPMVAESEERGIIELPQYAYFIDQQCVPA